MDYKPHWTVGGVHIGASGAPDDLKNGVHIFHMESMWTPDIVGFYGSHSRWTPVKAHVESMWSPSESVA